jgi:hypothetical protein
MKYVGEGVGPRQVLMISRNAAGRGGRKGGSMWKGGSSLLLTLSANLTLSVHPWRGRSEWHSPRGS